MYTSKEACPLLKLATFGDKPTKKGSLRHDDNVVAVYGIEADYDGEQISPQEAAERLRRADIESVIYTSASHTPEHPRWRVLAPLSGPCKPEERAGYVSLINGALGGILADESWAKSQIYYYGRVKDKVFECIHVPGSVFLDHAPLLCDITPIGKPAPSAKAKSDKPTADKKAGASEATANGSDAAERKRVLAEVTEQTLLDLESALGHLGKHTDCATDYPTWIEVGLALACLKGMAFEARALELWHEFSENDEGKYDPAECDAKWEGFAPTKSTHKSIFHWAGEVGWKNPKKKTAAGDGYENREDRTDAGNANLLHRLTEGNLRHVLDRREWLWWDGEKWIVDRGEVRAHHQALRVSEHYLSELAKLKSVEPGDDAEKDRLALRIKGLKDWANTCRNGARVSNMLEFLSKAS